MPDNPQFYRILTSDNREVGRLMIDPHGYGYLTLPGQRPLRVEPKREGERWKEERK